MLEASSYEAASGFKMHQWSSLPICQQLLLLPDVQASNGHPMVTTAKARAKAAFSAILAGFLGLTPEVLQGL